MNNLVITAAASVSEDDLRVARQGGRFGRMDLSSQLAMLAVASLQFDFSSKERERIAICLGSLAGSLSTDMEYWKGREVPGGLSPTVFTYTLPSAAIGEIAIRYGLTGPNLCLVGDDRALLSEAEGMIRQGEADACLVVFCEVIPPETAKILGEASAIARACALILEPGGDGLAVNPQNGRDTQLLCARFRAHTLGAVSPP